MCIAWKRRLRDAGLNFCGLPRSIITPLSLNGPRGRNGLPGHAPQKFIEAPRAQRDSFHQVVAQLVASIGFPTL